MHRNREHTSTTWSQRNAPAFPTPLPSLAPLPLSPHSLSLTPPKPQPCPPLPQHARKCTPLPQHARKCTSEHPWPTSQIAAARCTAPTARRCPSATPTAAPIPLSSVPGSSRKLGEAAQTTSTAQAAAAHVAMNCLRRFPTALGVQYLTHRVTAIGAGVRSCLPSTHVAAVASPVFRLFGTAVPRPGAARAAPWAVGTTAFSAPRGVLPAAAAVASRPAQHCPRLAAATLVILCRPATTPAAGRALGGVRASLPIPSVCTRSALLPLGVAVRGMATRGRDYQVRCGLSTCLHTSICLHVRAHFFALPP